MLKTRIAVVAVTTLVGVGLVPGTAQALPPENTFVSIGAGGAMPNGRGDRPQLSGDGRYVTFDSTATNLVPGMTTQGLQVFRRDLLTGATELVSVKASGVPMTAEDWNSFSWPSDDGRYVAFVSDDALTTSTSRGRKVYLRDMGAGTTEMISVNSSEQVANAPASRPMISSDGRFVAFSSKASNLSPLGGNGIEQVYLRDRALGTTTLVSTAPDGGLANDLTYRGMVSDDGKTVTYSSKASNIVSGDTNGREDVFLKDLESGRTVRMSLRADGSHAVGGGTRPYMSPDARYVVYNTTDPIVPQDTNNLIDVYMVDRQTGQTTWVSVSKDGGNGTGESLRGFVTNDGKYVVFNSFSNNLAERDPNGGRGDAFIRDMDAGKTYVLSLSHTGGGANGASFRPVPSADGSVVTFLSTARNLVPNDTSAKNQVYSVRTASVLPSSGVTDTTAPSLAITTPTGGSTNSNPVTFSGTVSDDVGVSGVHLGIRRTTSSGTYEWLQADGTSWGAVYRAAATLDGSGGWSLTAWGSLADGSYNANARAVDTSGNATSKWVGFKVATSTTQEDTTAPTATIDPVSGAVAGTAFAVTGTVNDDVAVDRVAVGIRDQATGTWLQADGTSWGSLYRHPATLSGSDPKSKTWSTTFTLPAGKYKAEAQAWDTSGNRLATKPYTVFTVSSP